MSAVLIEHNRRAVYSALVTVCKERTLLEQAFAFWEKNFSSSGAFRVSQYVDALVGHVGLSQEQRRELSVGLYSALAVVPTVLRAKTGGATPADVAAAPAAATSPARGVSPLSVSAKSGAAAVMGALISQLVDGAARAKQVEELAHCTNFAEAAISPPTLSAANQWVRGGCTDSLGFANLVPDKERAAVVNVVYIALCEAVGPSVADRILGQAVQHVERMPEAAEFSPKKLL
jgi:hypothetical protein